MKTLHYFLFLFIASFLSIQSFGQTFNITGTILDATDHQGVPGASVALLNASDSSVITGTATEVSGTFSLSVAPGTYRLRISSVGYEDVVQTVNVVDKDVTIPTISLSNSLQSLTGVTVTAEQLRAQQLGDTSQFNASSYKTNRDANAEELITKMPGVTSDNGTIKVNGEDVKQITVDGKPFFGDDPNAAIKNLPAEIIDKIQVFDKQSDQAAFTGFDDGNTQKTINIITKRGRNNGMFGKVSAGYGMDDASKDSRYTFGGNINFFNGDRRISIVGLANNVNQQNFSSEDLLGVSTSQSRGGGGGGGRGSRGSGGYSGGGGSYGGGGDASSNFLVNQQGGITQTQSIGLNYSDNWGKSVKITGSYFFNRSDNASQTQLTRSYIVSNPDSALVYNETGNTHSVDFNHRANVRLEWTIDSMNSLILNPRLSYQNNTTDRDLLGITTLGSLIEQGRIRNTYHAKNDGFNLSNQLTFRHRFAKRGRTLSLNIGTTYNDKTGSGTLYSLNEYLASDSTITDQQNTLSSNGLTLSGNLTYTEPITRKSQLSVTYSPSYNHNNSDRETYNGINGVYNDLDTVLSNKFNNKYYYQRGGFGWRYNDSLYSIMLALNGQYATLDGDQTFPHNTQINRTFTDLLPQAMLNYRFSRTENIRIFYRTNTNPPSITQLQNIVDNSNPLLLRTGNPDLRQDYSHNLSVRYGKTTRGKGSGLFIFANASYTNNYVGNSTIIALHDTTIGDIILPRSAQISKPINLDGNWSARSFLTYALPLKALKSNLNLSAGYTFNQIPALINNVTNFAKNHAINGGIVLGSNISENVDFTLSTSGIYTIVRNTLQAQQNYNYYTQNTAFRFNWIFADNFVFNTTLNHTFYSGLGEAYDKNYLLWNAFIGYKFLKSRAAQVDLYAFDILKKNQSISRTVTDTYIEDANTQVLQRYFMLRFTYTIRKFSAGATMPSGDEGNDHQGPGGHRGGGFRGNGGGRGDGAPGGGPGGMQ